MKNKWKKFVAMLLTSVLTSGSIQIAWAGMDYSEFDFIGEKEVYLTDSNQHSDGTIKMGTDTPEYVYTYREFEDGYVEIYTYCEGEMIEVVSYTEGKDCITTKEIENGEVISEEIETVNVEVIEDRVIRPQAYEDIGYLSYTNTITGKNYKINITLDEQFTTKYVTFEPGSYKIAKMAASIAVGFGVSAVVGTALIESIFASVITGEMVNLSFKKTVDGSESKLIWRGTGTDSKKPTMTIEGLEISYKDSKGKTKYHREGYYKTSDWKKPNFGREMLYKIYGIDEVPTYGY